MRDQRSLSMKIKILNSAMQKIYISRILGALSLLVAVVMPAISMAANTPCSGKKGGVAHCDGTRFVCNDGSYSASKKVCSAGDGSGASDSSGTARGGKAKKTPQQSGKTQSSPFN